MKLPPSFVPPPAFTPPPRARAASRSQAGSNIDAQQHAHEEHPSDPTAGQFKGRHFGSAPQHAKHHDAAHGRHAPKHAPPKSPPRRKTGSRRGNQTDDFSLENESSYAIDDADNDQRIAVPSVKNFNSEDQTGSNSDGNNNDGARVERRFRQRAISRMDRNALAAIDQNQAAKPDNFAEQLQCAAEKMRASARPAADQTPPGSRCGLSQEVFVQTQALRLNSDAASREELSNLAAIKAVLVKLPPLPPKSEQTEKMQTFNLVLPIMLLNTTRPRQPGQAVFAHHRTELLAREVKHLEVKTKRKRQGRMGGGG